MTIISSNLGVGKKRVANLFLDVYYTDFDDQNFFSFSLFTNGMVKRKLSTVAKKMLLSFIDKGTVYIDRPISA